MDLIDRRRVLAAAATFGAFAATPIMAASAPILDLTAKADAALVYRKLVWSLGQDFGGWWLEGTRYALVDSKLTPLWDMHVGTLFQVRDLPNGEYEVATISASFYTDLNTGDYITAFKSPFTGKPVDISYFPVALSKARYGVAGRIETAPPGSVSQAVIGPVQRQGDKILLREDHLYEGPPGSNGKIFRVNDMSTYFAPVSVMADPKIIMAPAAQTFSDILNWTDMAGPGTGLMYSRNYGQKAARLEDMPEIWRTLMRRTHPDIYSNPKAALGG